MRLKTSAVVVSFGLLSGGAVAQDLAILGATVIPANGGEPIANAIVTVEDGRITGIGPGAAIPEGAPIVNATGKFVTPGLVDTHVHLYQSSSLYTRPDARDLRDVRSYESDREHVVAGLDQTFRRYLASGVTALLDGGGPMQSFDFRDAALAAEVSPRVAVAGPMISTIEGSAALALNGDMTMRRAETPEAARALVKELAVQAPDLITFWYGVPAGQDPANAIATMKATIEEAGAARIRVAVHAKTYEDAKLALEAGCDLLVHGIDDAIVAEEFTALLAQTGALYTSSLGGSTGSERMAMAGGDLSAFEVRIADPWAVESWAEAPAGVGALSPERAAMRRERADRAGANAASVAAATDALILGTGAGKPGVLHGVSVHRELELLSRAGLSNEQIIEAATANAARAFSAEPEFGTVEVGKLADLLILDENPLEDIGAFTKIYRVIKGGVEHKPNELIEASPVSVVKAAIAAFNARDVDAYADLHHPGVEVYSFNDPDAAGTDENRPVISGQDTLRSAYAGYLTPEFPWTIRVMNSFADGETVAMHQILTAPGEEPVRAVVVYLLEDGQIRKVRNYYGSAGPLKSGD
ncbi:MAG: amidohydrolase family protein [Planctomycetota bacterium]